MKITSALLLVLTLGSTALFAGEKTIYMDSDHAQTVTLSISNNDTVRFVLGTNSKPTEDEKNSKIEQSSFEFSKKGILAVEKTEIAASSFGNQGTDITQSIIVSGLHKGHETLKAFKGDDQPDSYVYITVED
jgi:hypothetical protein